jgi:hypothetical protein
VELLVLVAPMIPGEAPDSYWTHARYSEGGAGPVRRCHCLFYQDVPPELAAQALNRARIQSEARMGEPSPLNAGIEQSLFLSESTVEKHVNAIFTKLGISAAPVHRRVVAVLAFLENAAHDSIDGARTRP